MLLLAVPHICRAVVVAFKQLQLMLDYLHLGYLLSSSFISDFLLLQLQTWRLVPRRMLHLAAAAVQGQAVRPEVWCPLCHLCADSRLPSSGTACPAFILAVGCSLHCSCLHGMQAFLLFPYQPQPLRAMQVMCTFGFGDL